MQALALPFSDPVLIFAVLTALTFGVPTLCRLTRVPPVIGLILVGILIGPSVLGILERDQTVVLLGNVGLLYILFLAGLSLDLQGFRRNRSRSLGFGALTLLIPLAVGTLAAVFILGFAWAPGILLASMFASHTLLSYPIVSKLGLAKNPAVTTTLSGSMISDTSALMILAIIAGSTRGALSLTFLLGLVVAVVVLIGSILYLLPLVGRLFFRRITPEENEQFLFLLASFVICGALARVAGVEPIIGAFFAGIALNRLIPQHSALMHRTDFVGQALFIPVFMISVGMVVDLGLMLSSPKAWLTGGVMIAAVVGTKWIAASLTAKIFHFSSDQRWVVFGLSVAQAAATLAAVFVGYDLGLFDDAVLNGTILMILVTCIISPAVADHFGRRIARAEAGAKISTESPQRIAVSIANPATTEALMSLALLIHDRDAAEPIYPTTIVLDSANAAEDVARAERNLSYALTSAAAAGVPAVPITRVDVNVVTGLTRAMLDIRARSMIIGWHGLSDTKDRVFGTILDQLLVQSEQTIWVCRLLNPINTHARIALAIPPFSERQTGFASAIQDIKSFVSQVDATLHIFATADTVHILRNKIYDIRPKIPLRWESLSAWNSLVPSLAAHTTDDDLLILLDARSASIAWTPGLDKLPRRFVKHFPERSCVFVYPAIESAEFINQDDHDSCLWSLLLENSGGPIALESYDGADAITELVEHLPDTPESAKKAIAAALVRRIGDFSVEAAPGVVLLDIHLHTLELEALAIGIKVDDTLVFPHVTQAVSVVWLLISPPSMSAANHLLRLTAVSRLIQRLGLARNPKEITQAIDEDSPCHPPSSTAPTARPSAKPSDPRPSGVTAPPSDNEA